MTWTRVHDRVLAEKCEGITTFTEDEHSGLCFWDEEDDEGFGPPLVQVAHYSTDLPAVVRAAEAWRKGDKNNRYWVLESAYAGLNQSHAVAHQINASCPDQFFDGYSPSPAAALAQALYQAVTA